MATQLVRRWSLLAKAKTWLSVLLVCCKAFVGTPMETQTVEDQAAEMVVFV